MAPELFPPFAADTLSSIQADPVPLDGAAIDLWACGIVFFVLLTRGRFPFQARTERDIVIKIRKGIFNIDESLSETSKIIIRSMLERDATRRATADQI